MKLGSCFESSAKALFDPEKICDVAHFMKNFKLVHGEVTGTGGDTLGIKYCHAWIEFEMNNGAEFCFDTETKHLIVKSTYYALGSVSYAVKYTKYEAAEMMKRFGHYGPWIERLIRTEVGVNPTFGNARKGEHYE